MTFIFARQNPPSRELSQRLIEHGYVVNHLPLIDLQPIELSPAQLISCQDAELKIFTSPFAIQSVRHLPIGAGVLAAVGARSAELLRECFPDHSVFAPATEEGAAALLRMQLPKISSAVIFSAVGGLSDLELELRAQQITVATIHSYQRRERRLTEDEIELLKNARAAFCASGAHLQVMLRYASSNLQLWVPSLRLLESTREAQWPAQCSFGATDQALLTAFTAR